MVEEAKRLYRSRTDRVLAGVLGGVAEYFGVEPSVVRIVYVVVTFFTGCIPGILLYLLMVIVVRKAPEIEDPETAAQQSSS